MIVFPLSVINKESKTKLIRSEHEPFKSIYMIKFIKLTNFWTLKGSRKQIHDSCQPFPTQHLHASSAPPLWPTWKTARSPAPCPLTLGAHSFFVSMHVSSQTVMFRLCPIIKTNNHFSLVSNKKETDYM